MPLVLMLAAVFLAFAGGLARGAMRLFFVVLACASMTAALMLFSATASADKVVAPVPFVESTRIYYSTFDGSPIVTLSPGQSIDAHCPLLDCSDNPFSAGVGMTDAAVSLLGLIGAGLIAVFLAVKLIRWILVTFR